MAKGLQGLFLALRYAAGAALLLMVAWLPGCSDVALPSEEMPASGPDLSYNKLVANYLKNNFKNRASYDAFAISTFRWVHSFKGWAWVTCVRFEDNGRPRAYAVFIKDGKVSTAGMPFRPMPATPKPMLLSTRWDQRVPGFWGHCTRPLFCPNRVAQALVQGPWRVSRRPFQLPLAYRLEIRLAQTAPAASSMLTVIRQGHTIFLGGG